MKIPEIEFPEPTFMITLTRGSTGSRRLQVLALRFALWVVPAVAADACLTDGAESAGKEPLWLTLALSWVTLAVTVFIFVSAMGIVGVRDGGEDAS